MNTDSGPLVSVIVPVYNTPEYMLSRAMRSILKQSLASFEVILVDDGSECDCASECDLYASSDSRVRVIHQSNGGVSAARNTGIEASCSPWIMFVDPDDEILPEVLEEAVTLADSNNLDVLYATEIDVRGGRSRRRAMNFDVNAPLKIMDSHGDLRMLGEYFVSYEVPHGSGIPKALSIGPVARLFRRETISCVRFNENLSIMEDAVFNSEVVLRARRVGLLDKAWYIYYSNSGSASNSMAFDGSSQLHVSTVKNVVEREGLSVNAYCSWVCTYYFMAVSALSIKRLLPYRTLKRAYELPYFNEAFRSLDRSKFDYTKSFTRLKYRLACSGHLRSLLLLYKIRNLIYKYR